MSSPYYSDGRHTLLGPCYDEQEHRPERISDRIWDIRVAFLRCEVYCDVSDRAVDGNASDMSGTHRASLDYESRDDFLDCGGA